MLLSLIGVYAFAAVWTLTPFVGWGRYAPDPSGVYCCIDYVNSSISYMVGIMLACYIIPILVMIFSYTSISIKAYRAREASKNCNKKPLHSSLTRVRMLDK